MLILGLKRLRPPNVLPPHFSGYFILATNTHAVIFLCKKPFNPSTPNMKMHFLFTVIHIFLIPLVGCLKFNINQDISSMVIISFILKSSVCDQVKVV